MQASADSIQSQEVQPAALPGPPSKQEGSAGGRPEVCGECWLAWAMASVETLPVSKNIKHSNVKLFYVHDYFIVRSGLASTWAPHASIAGLGCDCHQSLLPGILLHTDFSVSHLPLQNERCLCTFQRPFLSDSKIRACACMGTSTRHRQGSVMSALTQRLCRGLDVRNMGISSSLSGNS